MKYALRVGVFETNSSSSHSITVWGNVGAQIPKLTGVYKSHFDDFGWDGDDVVSWEDKVCYILTDLIGGMPKEDEENNPNLEMLKRVFYEATGAELTYPGATERSSWGHTGEGEGNDDYEFTGYVDHQSRGLTSYLFETDEQLVDFIFNPSWNIIIANDNG